MRRSSPSPLSGLVMLVVPDDEHLDTYLADRPALIPGAIMLYKQKNAVRKSPTIPFLKEWK